MPSLPHKLLTARGLPWDAVNSWRSGGLARICNFFVCAFLATLKKAVCTSRTAEERAVGFRVSLRALEPIQIETIQTQPGRFRGGGRRVMSLHRSVLCIESTALESFGGLALLQSDSWVDNVLGDSQQIRKNFPHLLPLFDKRLGPS